MRRKRVIMIGIPIDLNRLIGIDKPTTRVHYDLEEIGEPKLIDILDDFLEKINSSLL